MEQVCYLLRFSLLPILFFFVGRQYNTKQNKGISSSFVGVQIISAQTFATETHTHETKRRTTMKFETD